MRYVGAGGVVVAVPDWWTTGDTRCGAPVEDTVYFDNAAVVECGDPVPDDLVREVSALAVLDASHGTGDLWVRGMRPDGEVDGEEVVVLPGCNRGFTGVCRRLVAVPSRGVLLALSLTPDGGTTYEQVRDSMRVLPDGLTTLPLTTTDGWTPSWGAEPRTVDALVGMLRRHGFVVEKVTAAGTDSSVGLVADLPRGSLLDVSPSLGSVVEPGSTVRITVM